MPTRPLILRLVPVPVARGLVFYQRDGRPEQYWYLPQLYSARRGVYVQYIYPMPHSHIVPGMIPGKPQIIIFPSRSCLLQNCFVILSHQLSTLAVFSYRRRCDSMRARPVMSGIGLQAHGSVLCAVQVRIQQNHQFKHVPDFPGSRPNHRMPSTCHLKGPD